MLGMLVSLTGCGENGGTAGALKLQEEEETGKQEGTERQEDIVEIAGMEEVTETELPSALADYVQEHEKLAFDSGAWKYDEEHDVYYQIGVGYCSNPETAEYETMGIYVPGMYLVGEDNGDGTYTCTLNHSGTVKGYTSATAPIVFPVNTAGYSAQEAPVSYDYESISEYLEAGFVYVYVGMRGRSNGYEENGTLAYSGGAPWGVTDLKAAVRYYRYNSMLLPGNTDRIFTFGHSGGGAQSAVMGASGDSELYYPYLTSIGAAMYDGEGKLISDAICGAMCWCPITSLDYADAAYEWNMGQYADTGTRAEGTFTSALSEDLSEAYASYINKLGLQDGDGNVLTLVSSEDGIYAAGSYYEYLVSVVEQSLNHFLSDTEFPYNAEETVERPDGGFGGGGKPDGENLNGEKPENMPDGEKPGNMPAGEKPENAPDGEKPDGEKPENALDGENPGEKPDGENANGEQTGGENTDGENADGERTDGEKPQSVPGAEPDGGKTDGAAGENSDGGKEENGEQTGATEAERISDTEVVAGHPENGAADTGVADTTETGTSEGTREEIESGEDGTEESEGEDGEIGEDGIYETPQEYIDSLNTETVWVNYDEDTNTATITGLSDFARYCKSASKEVGAFDDLNLKQPENLLFGNDESDASHFDAVLTELLTENQSEYAEYTDWNPSVLAEYQSDMENLDKLGNNLTCRQNMYNPMYYISSYYEGSGTSTPASYWRIRSGIEQGDTALTVETNLALALEACDDVTDVDFETVWEQGHTMAERTGDAASNFIAWVQKCAAP